MSYSVTSSVTQTCRFSQHTHALSLSSYPRIYIISACLTVHVQMKDTNSWPTYANSWCDKTSLLIRVLKGRDISPLYKMPFQNNMKTASLYCQIFNRSVSHTLNAWPQPYFHTWGRCFHYRNKSMTANPVICSLDNTHTHTHPMERKKAKWFSPTHFSFFLIHNAHNVEFS